MIDHNLFEPINFDAHKYFIRLTQRLKGDLDTVVDAGVNKSKYLKFWSESFRNVLGFEANIHCYTKIKNDLENFQTTSNVKIFHEVLSLSNDTKLFYMNTTDSSISSLQPNKSNKPLWKKEETEIVKIRTIKLDSFLKNLNYNITAIKIDTEDEDENILIGSIGTIKRYKPIVYIEHYTPRTFNIFKKINYAFEEYNALGKKIFLFGYPDS